MSIQIPLIVWTVISFLILMFIVKELLLKPILKVIDSRAQKIEKARLLSLEKERLAEEEKIAYEAAKQEQIEKAKQNAEAILEKAKSDSEKAISELQQKRKTQILESKKEVALMQSQISEDINKDIDSIVTIFISGFTS